jgi:hypothetical protein
MAGGIWLAIIAHIPLLVLGVRRAIREGCGFFTFFQVIYCAAAIVPFVIIATEQGGWLPLHEWFTFPIPRVSLSYGNGLKPLLWILSVHACFLCGGLAAVWISRRRVKPACQLPILTEGGWERYRLAGALLLGVAGIYIAIRNVAHPDYPLFVLFGPHYNPKVREIAYEYGINRNLPWVFLPSIHSQFYRILLPLGTLVMLIAWRYGGRQRTLLIAAVTGAIASIAMSLGTMKRTPIVYLFLWACCCWCMYRSMSRRMVGVIVGAVAALFLVLVLITSKYNGTRHNLQLRLIYGEAVADYLAVEHHPGTYAYRGSGVFSPYVAKMFGGDARSFSQVWKTEVTGGIGRGYDAVGIFTEWYIAFGWTASLLASAILGFILSLVDCRLLRRGIANDERPFLAGLMMIIGVMTAKGMLSQIFTGGAFAVLLCYCAWRMIRPKAIETVSR